VQQLDGPFYLRVVRPDGSSDSEFRLNSRELAIAECDRIQRELNADGSPARAYVFDVDEVPIAVGGEHKASRYKRRA
jgi:hypothetical protein